METSYLAKWREFEKPVAICRTIPGWYQARTFTRLAPHKEWMNKPPEVYVPLFHEKVLGPLDPRQTYEELGEDVTLLCYEKDPTLCHRKLVAEWFEEKLNIKVREHDWNPKDQKTLDFF